MISVENESGENFPVELSEQAARSTLEHAGAAEADLTIVLGDDVKIRALNKEFLDNDAATDVLSFPAGEIDPATGRLYLGDVIVSLERAGEQARERGHSLDDEVQLLVVHGVLHLIGHDHAGAEEKERMWAAQAEILVSLGISPAIVHE